MKNKIVMFFIVALILFLVSCWNIKLTSPGITGAGGSSGGSSSASYWSKGFRTSGDDSPYSIIKTSDGGYLAISLASGEVVAIKLNADGSVAWQKAYTGNSNVAYRVVEVTNGYVIGGYLISGGNIDVWLTKVDTNGNIVWEKSYGGTQTDVGLSLSKTNDGGFIIAGYTYEGGKIGCLVIKLDGNGNVQWGKIYNWYPQGYDKRINNIIQTSDGGYLMVGYGTSPDDFINHSFICKLDANGNQVWYKLYASASSNDSFLSAIQASDGNYIVAGRVSLNSGDGWLLKIKDLDGSIMWQYAYGTSSSPDSLSNVIETNDGGILALGTTGGYTQSGATSDAWILKLDQNGTLQWHKSYDTYTDSDFVPLFSKVLDKLSDGYIVNWASLTGGSAGIDMIISKIDLNGDLPTGQVKIQTNTNFTPTPTNASSHNITLLGDPFTTLVVNTPTTTVSDANLTVTTLNPQ